MDTWQQVSISVTREAVEATANLFCEAGARNGVEIDDPLLLKELKEHTTWELCDLPMPEETEIVTVSAYYPEDEELSGRLSTIKEGLSEIEKRIGSFQVGQLRFRKVSEKDWANEWKQYFHTTKIGSQIVIKPDWESEELVDALPDVTVDCGDGTDRQLLDEEHLENMDGFVACTGIDEVNAILSLYVMNRVKKKVVTKLNHVDFGELLDNLHLDSVINPKEITAQKIVQYVRAAGNSMESNVETLYRLMNGRVEAMEFFIDKDSLVTGQKLVDMKIKDGVIIAGILRGGRLIIPGGQDEFRIGDTVIVVTTHIGFHDIYNILK